MKIALYLTIAVKTTLL